MMTKKEIIETIKQYKTRVIEENFSKALSDAIGSSGRKTIKSLKTNDIEKFGNKIAKEIITVTNKNKQNNPKS